MALIAKQAVGLPGAAVTFVAASGGGDTVAVDQAGCMLLVKNGGGGSLNVTIADPRTPYGQTQPGVVLAVAAGAEAAIALPQELANASGNVSITYSGVTSLTVAALRR